MQRTAVRESLTKVSSSQRSEIAHKKGSLARIDMFKVFDSSRFRSSRRSRNSKLEVGPRQSKVLEAGPDRVSVTENPNDAAVALHQLPVKSRVQNFWQNSPCD